MWKRNQLLMGILLGVLAPIAAFLLTQYTSLKGLLSTKPLALYVLAATVNLFLLRYYYKQHLSRTGAGIAAATFVALLMLWFIKDQLAI